MTIGQRIREQRRKAELTQEQLAELLSVSPQAVSRWETDAAMPDISLLLPLCNLFGVSADYLLGMETYEKDLRRAEFDEAFKDYWKHDDKEKNYEIACRAAAEYPGDMPYLEWLASAEFYLAFLRGDDAEYRALLESAVGHYRTVLDRADDGKLLAQARHGIVLSLHHLGRNAEARAFAEAEEDERKRGEMLVFCLEGEAKRQHCQKLADGALFELLMRLRDIGGLEACDAAERIVGLLFPDGNLGFLHNTLQNNAVQKAFLLCAARVGMKPWTRCGRRAVMRKRWSGCMPNSADGRSAIPPGCSTCWRPTFPSGDRRHRGGRLSALPEKQLLLRPAARPVRTSKPSLRPAAARKGGPKTKENREARKRVRPFGGVIFAGCRAAFAILCHPHRIIAEGRMYCKASACVRASAYRCKRKARCPRVR